MNHTSLILIPLILTICLAAQASAQQASATASVEYRKIAVIETEAFYDLNQGIARLINTMKKLDLEMDPLHKEVRNLEQRYQSLADEVARLETAANAKALEQKRFEAETLQRELKRRAEDAEEKFQHRLREMVGPIAEDLQKAIGVYAEQRGIAWVIDLSAARDLILYASEAANITRDFINDYNRRNSSVAP